MIRSIIPQRDFRNDYQILGISPSNQKQYLYLIGITVFNDSIFFTPKLFFMIETNMPITELEDLRQNYESDAPTVETRVVVIARNQLEDFLNLLPPGWDAIKINLIRYPLTTDQGHIKKKPTGNFSQVSVILTPGTLLSLVDWNAADMVNPDNTSLIHSLSVCKPATTQAAQDKTSLCPPKSSCP